MCDEGTSRNGTKAQRKTDCRWPVTADYHGTYREQQRLSAVSLSTRVTKHDDDEFMNCGH